MLTCKSFYINLSYDPNKGKWNQKQIPMECLLYPEINQWCPLYVVLLNSMALNQINGENKLAYYYM